MKSRNAHASTLGVPVFPFVITFSHIFYATLGFTLTGVHDAEGIRAILAEEKAQDVVIVGGGLIGVETTEALVHKGCRVTISPT